MHGAKIKVLKKDDLNSKGLIWLRIETHGGLDGIIVNIPVR